MENKLTCEQKNTMDSRKLTEEVKALAENEHSELNDECLNGVVGGHRPHVDEGPMHSYSAKKPSPIIAPKK